MVGRDGCFLTGLPIVYLEPNVDWPALFQALGVTQKALPVAIDAAFAQKLDAMTNEDWIFVFAAWNQVSYRNGLLDLRPSLTYAHKLALGRVCRRIIREYQEAQQCS